MESGVGWIPFVKEALDHGYAYANVSTEKPEFDRRPSEYMREQVWACTFFEKLPTNRFLDNLGDDRALFETDCPHPICLHGDEVRERIDGAFGDLTADVRKKMLFDNAAELYGIEAPDREWNGVAGA